MRLGGSLIEAARGACSTPHRGAPHRVDYLRGGREGQIALENEEAHAAVNLVDEPGPGAKHARKTEQRTRKGSNEGMGKAEAEG